MRGKQCVDFKKQVDAGLTEKRARDQSENAAAASDEQRAAHSRRRCVCERNFRETL